MSKQAAITENISEKPKRGRPPVIPDTFFSDKFVEFIYGPELVEYTTRRSKVSLAYRALAEETIACAVDAKRGEEAFGEFAWLRNKKTLLTELGRMLFDADMAGQMLATARELCEWKPTTKEGVAWVRSVRIGKPALWSIDDLVGALARAIDGFRACHRTSVELPDVIEALREVEQRIFRMMDEGQK